MITIYTLEGCSYCKWLVTELDNIKLPYRNINVIENDELATSLEDMLNTTIYPIVHISKPLTDVYLIAEADEHYYFDNSKIIFVYNDIPHLVQLIKRNL